MTEQVQAQPIPDAEVAPALPNPPAFDPAAESLVLKGKVTTDFKLVVNRAWVAFWREQAQADTASPFLKQLQEQHPVNDNAFIEGLLRNGIRHSATQNIVNLSRITGLGGTVAPSSVELMPHVQGVDSPVGIQVLQKEQA